VFKQKPDKASPRQARQLDWIAQFASEIRHVSGHQNVIADALSRIETVDASVLVSTDEPATEQATDEELRTLRQGGNSLDLREINLPDAKLPLFCDVSEGTIRPYVPKTLRRRIFDAVHGLAHPNGKATSRQIRQKFTWPGINKDIVHGLTLRTDMFAMPTREDTTPHETSTNQNSNARRTDPTSPSRHNRTTT